jgi:hypothetical protein
MTTQAPTSAQPFLTVDDLVAELGVGRLAVLKLLRTGEIPGRIVGNKWRVSPVEWERCRASFSQTAPRAASPAPVHLVRKRGQRTA